MSAEVGLSDVMEHLAIAFSGIYEEVRKRDAEIENMKQELRRYNGGLEALSNRIEGVHRSLSERVAVLEVPKAP